MNELKNVCSMLAPVSAGCLSDVLPYWLLFLSITSSGSPGLIREDKWRTVVTREKHSGVDETTGTQHKETGGKYA